MSRELADHLGYYAELGVTGISRDPTWRDARSRPRRCLTAARLARSRSTRDDSAQRQSRSLRAPPLTHSTVIKTDIGADCRAASCARSAAARSCSASATPGRA